MQLTPRRLGAPLESMLMEGAQELLKVFVGLTALAAGGDAEGS
jgi:hypothetical protein